MAKTRSQIGKITIKKEEEEDCKSTLLLNGASNTRNNNRIAKRTVPKNRKSRLPAQDIKVEKDTDTKSLLQSSSKYSKRQKRQRVSQEQINQLIDAIVNDKMSVYKAAPKVKMGAYAAVYYYKQYKNDPEKKIPSPKIRLTHSQRFYTQQHIGNLIKYIVDDKMTIKEASEKADLTYKSGKYYYKKYLDDPEHNISRRRLSQYSTQDEKNELIGYIVNDKMSITAASRKAKMSANAGNICYHEYFTDQNPNIATPSHIAAYIRYTQEQIKEVISYIIDGKMSIRAASKKANMSLQTATKYYRQYFKDNNMEIPVSKYSKHVTQDRIDEFMGYIVDDKMTIIAASKKANMNHNTGYKYYRQCLKNRNIDVPTRKYIRQDQIDELIGYIVDDKMSITAASKKVNMSYTAGEKYYKRYIKAHRLDSLVARSIPQDQIDELIGYIVDDKLTIKAASKKANMSYTTGVKYYKRYLKVHNLDPPAPKDRQNQLIGYIINDKMTIKAASKKANMSYTTGRKYYYQYLKNQTRDAPTHRDRIVSASKNEQ